MVGFAVIAVFAIIFCVLTERATFQISHTLTFAKLCANVLRDLNSMYSILGIRF